VGSGEVNTISSINHEYDIITYITVNIHFLEREKFCIYHGKPKFLRRKKNDGWHAGCKRLRITNVKNAFSASVMSIWLQLPYINDVNIQYILPDGRMGRGMKSSPYVAKHVIRCLTEIP
jgi:hypothetical protein